MEKLENMTVHELLNKGYRVSLNKFDFKNSREASTEYKELTGEDPVYEYSIDTGKYHSWVCTDDYTTMESNIIVIHHIKDKEIEINVIEE